MRHALMKSTMTIALTWTSATAHSTNFPTVLTTGHAQRICAMYPVEVPVKGIVTADVGGRLKLTDAESGRSKWDIIIAEMDSSEFCALASDDQENLAVSAGRDRVCWPIWPMAGMAVYSSPMSGLGGAWLHATAPNATIGQNLLFAISSSPLGQGHVWKSSRVPSEICPYFKFGL